MITYIKKTLRHFGLDIVKYNKKVLSNRDLYEHDLAVVVQKEHPVVFDVGANSGQSIEVFLRIFNNPSIFSFEPNPKLHAFLKSNYQENCHVKIIPMGLGSEDIENNLFVYESDALSSFKPISNHKENPFHHQTLLNKVKCNVIRLDTFLQERNIARIDLLKIDTQGYEFEVLKGAHKALREGIIQHVYLELNFIEIYKNQSSALALFDLLFSYDFKLVGLYDLDRPDGHIRWCNALFSR